MTISLNLKPSSTMTYYVQQLFPPFRHLPTSLRSSHPSLVESFPYQWVRQPGIPWFFPSKLPPTHTNQLNLDRSSIYHGDLGEMQSRGGKLLLLFFFLFIFISWRLITVQYCSGFCHTLTWKFQVEPGPALVFTHPKSYHFPSFNEA